MEKCLWFYTYADISNEIIGLRYDSFEVSGNWASRSLWFNGFCMYGDKIYLCGLENYKVCKEYSIVTGKFSMLPVLPCFKFCSAAEVIKGKYLYSVGGFGVIGLPFHSVHKLVLGTNRWLPLPNINENVGLCSLCNAEDRYIYRIGGFTRAYATYTKTIERLDLLSEESGWELINYKGPFIDCELCVSTQCSPNTLLIFGGRRYKETLEPIHLQYGNHELLQNCFELSLSNNTMKLSKNHLNSEAAFACIKPSIIKGNVLCIDTSNMSLLKLSFIDKSTCQIDYESSFYS